MKERYCKFKSRKAKKKPSFAEGCNTLISGKEYGTSGSDLWLI